MPRIRSASAEDAHDHDRLRPSSRTDRARARAASHARPRCSDLAAEARARAVLPAGADLRLRLQSLDAVSVLHQLQGVHQLNFIGWANYQKLWNWTFETDPPSNWYTAIVNMGLFGGLYVIFCLVLGLTAGDPARPEDPRRRHPAADLSLSAGAVLHRHRHGVEAVSRSGHRPREGGARSRAGRASSSTGSSIRA